MCGIAGILNTDGAPVDEGALRSMARALRHRGPDDEGVWVDGRIGLAHRRLSIIDLADGHQPMSNEAGTTWVCFNGEIYNHVDLRRELQARGATFRTQCDTEVLVHLYDALGEAMLEQLVGMFAFALYDASRGRLILARDRMGQKPLLYFRRPNCLAFASEMQALRLAPGFPSDIRPQSVHDYLTFQYVPSPHTIYAGVRKLPPACVLSCARDTTDAPEPKPYWSLNYGGTTPASLSDSADRLRNLLRQAVRGRLMSDVPLGAFLSGGIDSTVTVGLMAEAMRDPVETFTIGFSEAKYDERPYAATAAARFATHHHVRVVDPSDFAVVRTLVRHYGEPYSDASMLPTYLLSGFARERVTVALSGDGADELFGGYYRYLAMGYARLFDFLPLGLRRPLASSLLRCLPPRREERTVASRMRRIIELAMSSAAPSRYLDLINRAPEAVKRSLYGPAMRDGELEPSCAVMHKLFGACTSRHPTQAVSEVDVHSYLPGDILTKVDIASMAHSLEVRSPFMDHRVVEFAASLPWSHNQARGARKRVLQEACADLIPAELARRPKLGFGVPIARWFRGSWRQVLQDVLTDPSVREHGFLEPKAVGRLIEEHCSGAGDHSYALWALLLLQLWLQDVHGVR